MPQSLSCVLPHIVFSTKNREKLIVPAIEHEMHAYMAAAFQRCQSPALSINGTEDHVHCYCSLTRTISIAQLVERVKSSSSGWRRKSDPRFQWQNGYAAFSIGRSSDAALRHYIAAQKEHHKKVSYKDELRALFKKYDVGFDEQYVWD